MIYSLCIAFYNSWNLFSYISKNRVWFCDGGCTLNAWNLWIWIWIQRWHVDTFERGHYSGETFYYWKLGVTTSSLLLLLSLSSSLIITFMMPDIGVLGMHSEQTNLHSLQIINLLSTISPWSSGPSPLIRIAIELCFYHLY